MHKIIDYLKSTGALDELNSIIPYAGFVGFDVLEENGELLTTLKANPDNIGNEIIGAIHGGVIGALLEHAATFHLLNELESAHLPRIVNISIDYLRPALNKDTFARAVVIKKGKRVVNLRVSAWQDNEKKCVAAAHAHFLIA